MKPVTQPDLVVERHPSSNLWDTLIRVGLMVGLAALCLQVFSPFLKLMAWAVILAVTMYPVHQGLARRIGGKQGLTSIIFAIVGIALIVVPTWLLMNSFADSVRGFFTAVQQNTLHLPPPSEGVKNWPAVGNKIYN